MTNSKFGIGGGIAQIDVLGWINNCAKLQELCKGLAVSLAVK